MKMLVKFAMMMFLLSEGSIEILEFLSRREYGYFKELRKLQNVRTNTYFSSTTISERLKDLIRYGVIEKVIAEQKGRNVVAYKITEDGVAALKLMVRSEEELVKHLKPIPA